MSTFAILLLCIQACLVQNVFTQCIGYGSGIGAGLGAGLAGRSIGLGLSAIAPAYSGAASNYGLISPAAAIAPGLAYGGAAYGGTGEGNVVVYGEIPVAGNTAVAGQVPISGIVGFSGAVPAAGAVTIAGKCSCGCGTYGY